ncbi:HEPN domain-containing protein [Spirosoma montaniterrae]|uniref:HEPN domain-containing protein n=1 Tax=Spirosoma montaniterrae TaxID=1178516 RepID=A0A1P9WTT4_9BACT|nr:HEPN domain-containing protein [Spirosoma montaniterrae]AQG78758.1 hypothetical protein AWR27_05105 [Spirosoma montaniterrae]
MNDIIAKYLERAESALDAADVLLENDQNLALANRSYYAIFYCICALLLTERIVTKKHEGARVKFHELFVKTGRFSKDAGRMLERNFEARQSADYDMETEITKEQAQLLLHDARAFYQLTLDYFTQHPPVENQ